MSRWIKDIDYNGIEEEISEELSGKILEIDPETPAALVRAPVAIGPTGITDFLPVSEVIDLDKLPFIGERHRDFAFRYATEYKTIPAWSAEYGVAEVTIRRWLSNPGVRQLIAIARYEQRMYNLAQKNVMNKRVYTTINKLLNVKITADTIGPLVSLVKFIYTVLNDPQKMQEFDGVRNFNVNVGVNNAPPEFTTPYTRTTKSIPEVTPKDLMDMRASIDELEMIANDFQD